MSEWWTYRLSDFVLFSAQTYHRLFALYNLYIWPMQLLAISAGISVLVLLYWHPPWHGRTIAAILAACWLWIAWAFHLQQYSTINWAATYFAAAFFGQAALLIWAGVIRGRLDFYSNHSAFHRIALGIFLFALTVYPCLAPLTGRTWTESELFGIAPDPTVMATLGVLLHSAKRVYWWLLIIPLSWCVLSGTLLWIMDAAEAVIIGVTALTAVVMAIVKTFRPAAQASGHGVES